jgi:hypothetical protein
MSESHGGEEEYDRECRAHRAIEQEILYANLGRTPQTKPPELKDALWMAYYQLATEVRQRRMQRVQNSLAISADDPPAVEQPSRVCEYPPPPRGRVLGDL